MCCRVLEWRATWEAIVCRDPGDVGWDSSVFIRPDATWVFPHDARGLETRNRVHVWRAAISRAGQVQIRGFSCNGILSNALWMYRYVLVKIGVCAFCVRLYVCSWYVIFNLTQFRDSIKIVEWMNVICMHMHDWVSKHLYLNFVASSNEWVSFASLWSIISLLHYAVWIFKNHFPLMTSVYMLSVMTIAFLIMIGDPEVKFDTRKLIKKDIPNTFESTTDK